MRQERKELRELLNKSLANVQRLTRENEELRAQIDENNNKNLLEEEEEANAATKAGATKGKRSDKLKDARAAKVSWNP